MSDIELIKIFLNTMMDKNKEQKTDFEMGLYMGFEGVKDFIEHLESFMNRKEGK